MEKAGSHVDIGNEAQDLKLCDVGLSAWSVNIWEDEVGLGWDYISQIPVIWSDKALSFISNHQGVLVTLGF